MRKSRPFQSVLYVRTCQIKILVDCLIEKKCELALKILGKLAFELKCTLKDQTEESIYYKVATSVSKA